jgi:hypothetical protein
MAPADVHSRILTQAARTVLTPLGVCQRGRSRIWLDDHGWWLGVVEFQPSGWAKGAYLNVGAMWLWRSSDSLSFDYGHRVESFREFRDPERFESAAGELAERAAQEVQHLRERFASVESVAKALAAGPQESEWSRYHAAIAAAAAGHSAAARDCLESLTHPESGQTAWQRDLAQLASELQLLLDRPDSFGRWVDDTIRATRAALKLPVWQGTFACQDRAAAS